MSGLDKNRLRNQTIAFRSSVEERQQIEARVKITGLPKGEYILKTLLEGEISIRVGKYQSDRLSLELRKLREQIDMMDKNEKIIHECKALLDELVSLCRKENLNDLTKK